MVRCRMSVTSHLTERPPTCCSNRSLDLLQQHHKGTHALQACHSVATAVHLPGIVTLLHATNDKSTGHTCTACKCATFQLCRWRRCCLMSLASSLSSLQHSSMTGMQSRYARHFIAFACSLVANMACPAPLSKHCCMLVLCKVYAISARSLWRKLRSKCRPRPPALHCSSVRCPNGLNHNRCTAPKVIHCHIACVQLWPHRGSAERIQR